MYILITIIVVVIILLVIYAVIFDKEYSVSVSQELSVPVDTVFNTISDLTKWKEWNPWIMYDPENIEISYSNSPAPNEVNGSYSWKSILLGEGTLKNIGFEQNTKIVQEFKFIKPFKTNMTTTWNLVAVGEQTKVTWSLTGQLPFVLRAFKKMFQSSITKDYRTGLLRLHKYLNANADSWNMTFNHFVEIPNTKSYGYFCMGDMNNILQKQFVDIEIPAGKCLKSVYYGSYDYLDLAWHQAINNLQRNKCKFDKKRKPCAVRLVGPNDTDNPNDYVTEIYYPIK